MSSWYLRRFYGFVVDQVAHVALNEVQRLANPHGGADVHGQLSHTWIVPEGSLLSYHYNLRDALAPLETLAFFYTDDPPTVGIFPAGQDVVYLALSRLPANLQKRWPADLKADEIRQHGERVGNLFWEEDKR